MLLVNHRIAIQKVIDQLWEEITSQPKYKFIVDATPEKKMEYIKIVMKKTILVKNKEALQYALECFRRIVS